MREVARRPAGPKRREQQTERARVVRRQEMNLSEPQGVVLRACDEKAMAVAQRVSDCAPRALAAGRLRRGELTGPREDLVAPEGGRLVQMLEDRVVSPDPHLGDEPFVAVLELVLLVLLGSLWQEAQVDAET